MTELVEYAKNYAIACHKNTNHKYDNKPYSTHLKMVYDYGVKYSHLLHETELPFALAACWTHDLIEDCRVTYNDVKKVLGEQIAEITYALTNEKGKNRKQRANDKYYQGIRDTPLAAFVKICDRLANAKYSKNKEGGMLDGYRREFSQFDAELNTGYYSTMFDELAEILFADTKILRP